MMKKYIPEKKKIVGVLVLALFAFVLAQSLFFIPQFGDLDVGRDVSSYYIDNSLEKTGSANIVNSIVWDFRSYDTLGEETVLFAATIGIVLLVRRRKI
ncbi:MAG: hydrogen gas-evolving membrane-bound hydrogenase subunit E [Nanoarchaeota archaeon]